MSANTRDNMLLAAQFLIRTRGYSAFSYADLAERVNIRKASIHHYFPSKEDLVVVLVREYVEQFKLTIDELGQRHTRAGDRLRAFARLFLEGFQQGMMPFCGALSAERSALPEVVWPQLAEFFQIQLDWLRRVVEEGRAAGTIREKVSAEHAALVLLSALEGGSVVGWAMENPSAVLAAFEAALRTIEVADPRP